MRTGKVPPCQKTIEIDVVGRLLDQVEQYAIERGITDEEAAAELLAFALKARFKSPKKRASQVLRFRR
jgi:hypothetical protein